MEAVINEEDEFWFLNKLIPSATNNAGRLVETKTGTLGRIYNREGLVNGKYRVYCVDGSKLLCSPENLTLKGFID